jgi:DNA repair exonuclease SbcCD ATPase subunit
MTIEPTVGGKSSGLDLPLYRNGRKIGYKAFSGGERRLVDIALILAFQRFQIEASGLSSNLLVFDEIFDGLDRFNVERVLGAIEALFPESNAIYVITHNDSLKSVFSSVIRVVKEESISTIQDYETSQE